MHPLLDKRSLICLNSHTYQLLRDQKRNCKWRISRTKRFWGIGKGDELSKPTNWNVHKR